MAPNDAIQLRAQAKKLSIPNYRTMGLDELRKAVEGVGSSSGGAKRKSPDNGGGSKRKSATKVTTGAKGKTTKSAKRKKSPAKTAPAAQSAKGKAKRSSSGGAAKSAGAKLTCHSKGCRRKAPNRGRYAGYCDEHRDEKAAPLTAVKSKRKSSTTKATRSAPARKQSRGGKDTPGRAPIDNSSVDWTADWNGGQRGNRKTIMAALRKHKGDKGKVFKALSPKAMTMYPKQQNGRKRSKQSAESLLRWHIGRIAFDFVTATGQHAISENRAGYGTSNGKARQKGSGASTRSASAKGGKKSTTGSKTRKKASTSAKKTAGKKKTVRK